MNKETIKQIINNSDYDYSDGFVFWVENNMDIFSGFAAKALTAYHSKHKHRFGARAIIEILRWETFLADKDKTFKINNDISPDLARLTMDCYPVLEGYFSIRGSIYRNDAHA